MQNDMNYRAGNQGGDQGNGEMAPASEGPASQQLAPGPSNLGSVPQGAVNNVPPPRPSPTQQPGAKATSGHVVLTPPNNAKPTGPITAAGSSGEASTKYNAAMDLLARGAYDQARASFRAVADQYPNDKLAQEALYWTGDISYSAKKDYAEAARSFAEMLKKYPKAPHAPEGMLKLGQSLIGLGQKQEGCATLAAFPAKYPTASKTLLAKAKADSKKAACK
jgi:tol-pal system protein YbgF